MTEKWEGFTQEEISRISRQKQQQENPGNTVSNSPVKKMIFKQNKLAKKNITRERILKSSNKPDVVTDRLIQEELPSGARLFTPQIQEEDEAEEPESQGGAEPALPPPVPSEPSDKSNPSMPELLESPREANLEDFEKRQKLIQEQNRLRKEFLKKALEDRTKKTHEEARRLGQIEEELKKLDVQLSNDVSILRNQIEVASLEFMEAQKRFDRAEREYLDAKLALFTKRERKELLTGHLCTIIEQNELRKAKKLSDLLNKLHVGSVVIEKPFEVPYEPKDGTKEEQRIEVLETST